MQHVYPLSDDGLDPLEPTIFHESWWLEAASGARYEIVEARRAGRRAAWLPTFTRRKFGVKTNLPPRLVHFLGPAVDPGEGDAAARAYVRAALTRELAAALPRGVIHSYKCDRFSGDVVAFQLEGFSTALQFTHELGPAPAEMLWRAMRKKKRSQIRRAQACLRVAPIDDGGTFARFYADMQAARGQANYYAGEPVAALVDESLARRRASVLGAYDGRGALAAAAWILRDRTSAYYFMSARAVDAHDGAASLLVWKAIEGASARGLAFDFGGVSTPESVAFFAGFGGAPAPRVRLARADGPHRAVWAIRERLRANRHLC